MTMEVLYNARIIRNLTDKEDSFGLWQVIKNIEFRIGQASHKLGCVKNGKECEDCECLENWCFISADSLLSVPDTFVYKKLIAELNLDALRQWLVDESTSEADLRFRIEKFKRIVGAMWGREDCLKIRCLLYGWEYSPKLEIGKHWEIKSGFNPTIRLSQRLFNLVKDLDKEMSEDEVDNKAMHLNRVLCEWFRNIEQVVYETTSIIEEAENILNPLPDTSTEESETKAPVAKTSSKEELAKAGRPKGKEVKPFESCLLGTKQEQEKTMALLTDMLKGKKGRNLALIVTAAIKVGRIIKPSFNLLEQSFDVKGDKSGYNLYMQEGSFEEYEIMQIADKFGRY